MIEKSEQWILIQSLFEQALSMSEDKRQVLLGESESPDEVIKEVNAMLNAHFGEPLAMESNMEPLRAENAIPQRFGPYQISKELGRGGMSIVYLGVRDDNTFNLKVAIKTLNLVSTAAIRDRFRHEQRIHARLNHPNIARLLDAGVSPSGKPFLIMQFVDGLSIIDYANAKKYDLEERLKLIIQVCEAISFAHSQLILHRDIKPSNIMVDNDGQAVLLDFGIAKLLNESNEEDQHQLTREGELLMTLSYASPEQIRGEELGTASDVYSLGVVFYELLSDFRPFYGGGDYELSDAILNREVSLPTETVFGQKIPRDLQAIAVKTLEKRPQDRYASVAAFSDDIQRYLNHEAISVNPPNIFQWFVKFWRRNPITAPLGTIAIIGIITSLALALWQAHIADQQRILANAERDKAEQVVELLLDLFDSDPFADSESRRDDLTLRAFLTSRADNMESQLNDQPELQSQLFRLFASLLSNLGQLEQAEPMAVKALSMQRKLYGNKHLEVAGSANTLGILRQFQARYDEAEVLLREALSIRMELLRENHPDTADSINNLSTLLYDRGDLKDQDEMIELDERAMAIREQNFGINSLQVAQSLNNIASAKISRNQDDDWSEAESMFRRALSIRQDKLGKTHVNSGNIMSNLANLLHDMGQLEEAESLFLQAIGIAENALGKDHTRVAAALYGLGHLYKDQTRWDEAHQVFTRSLNINQATLPPKHPYIIDDMAALIDINIGRNELTQANKLLQEIKAMDSEDADTLKKISNWQSQLETNSSE